MAIHVDPDGRVLIDAPRHAEKADIRVAVTKRLGWVNRRLIEVEAVSYTHLDVYKRQRLFNAARC